MRDVRGVWAHETGGGRLLIVVSITQRFCGHSRQAGYITAQCQAAAYMNRFVIVVDDDVDPMNLEEVMWAVSTRCEPADDIEIMRKSWGSKVDPLLANPAVPYNTRALIDACRPFEKTRHVSTRGAVEPGAGARDRRQVEGTVRRPALSAAGDGDPVGRGEGLALDIFFSALLQVLAPAHLRHHAGGHRDRRARRDPARAWRRGDARADAAVRLPDGRRVGVCVPARDARGDGDDRRHHLGAVRHSRRSDVGGDRARRLSR